MIEADRRVRGPAADDALVAIVCPYCPWPIEGGGIARLWSMIAALRSEGFRVALVAPGLHLIASLRERPPVDLLFVTGPDGHLQIVCRKLPTESLTARARLWGAVMADLKRLDAFLRAPGGLLSGRCTFGDLPLARTVLRPPNAAVEELCRLFRPTAVIAHLATTAGVLDQVPPGILRVIDTIDLQHLRVGHTPAGAGHVAGGWSRAEEAAAFRRADVVVAIQEDEARIMREMAPERTVISVSHVPTVSPVAAGGPAAREVLFVGNDYPPNNEALLGFLRDCWPGIHAEVPDVTFRVCGKVCRALPAPLPAGVERAGFVPDLAAAYARAAIVINPVERGTGLKIKTVEALVHGKCVVGSAHCLHGLPLPHDGPPVVVVPREEMARTIVSLLLDEFERVRWEARARAYAERHLTRRAVYAPLVDVLRRGAGVTERAAAPLAGTACF